VNSASHGGTRGSRRLRADVLLFDLDGTLVDTAQDLSLAANAIRDSHGMRELPVERVAAFVGKGAEVLVHRVLADQPEALLDAARRDQAMRLFEAAYERFNGVTSQLYPGVRSGLERLHQAGIPMAVVTNKPQRFSDVLLEKMGLAAYFRFVQGGDVLPYKKPRPEALWHAIERLGSMPEKACMLGDSHNDAMAARAAGVPVFLVPYGYNEGRDPSLEDCDGLVDSVEAFATLVLGE